MVRLGSRADADDLVQETFLRLAGAPARLAGVENLVAYVFTVARNEAMRLDERRSRERRRLDTLAAEDLFCEAVGEDDRACETAEWVAAALARLAPEVRELVELKTYGGLTIREISDVTGALQSTVATRYRRALEMMRRRMTKEWE
jgi:RNA polymerase sigma-70 factor (ECF subfamily)